MAFWVGSLMSFCLFQRKTKQPSANVDVATNIKVAASSSEFGRIRIRSRTATLQSVVFIKPMIALEPKKGQINVGPQSPMNRVVVRPLPSGIGGDSVLAPATRPSDGRR